VAELRRAVAALAPFLAQTVAETDSWNQVKTLQVCVDRLPQWFCNGLLCIGDAARVRVPLHANPMCPAVAPKCRFRRARIVVR
jgi:hypothetical protein